jgi:hypothetical protein
LHDTLTRRDLLTGAAAVGVAAIGGTTWGRAADDGPAAARDTFRPSWDFSHGDLRVSDNKRFLVHSDGTPFFYLSEQTGNSSTAPGAKTPSDCSRSGANRALQSFAGQ